MRRNDYLDHDCITSNLQMSQAEDRLKNSYQREEMDQNTRWQIFSCQTPKTPSMCRLSDRLQTYGNWPQNHIKATPAELAQAGFIYLGQYDKLKCFYCNGGLQNWTYDQNPWFEHAKWYPNCEYLLRLKGIDFIQQINNLFPNLHRPILQDISSNFGQNSNDFSSHLPLSSCYNTLGSDRVTNKARNPPHGPTSSQMSGSKDLKRKLVEAMETEIVKETLPFGFNDVMIENLVKRKLEKENAEYESVMTLVNDLQIEEAIEIKIAASSEENRPSMETNVIELTSSSENCLYSTAQQPGVSTASVYTQSLEGTAIKKFTKILPKKPSFNNTNTSDRHVMTSKEINERLRCLMNETTCKICLDREINALFMPCGHLSCCIECASAVNDCPICRKKLKKIIKIYRP